MILTTTTPDTWYKMRRQQAETEQEMERITEIYELARYKELHVKIPFKIELANGQLIDQKVWITGYKTDGTDLFTEFMITGKGPKLTQRIK